MSAARWPQWVEQWVIPYVQEPALRPVLFALLGHVVVVMVPIVLAVARAREGWAVFALALAVAATLSAVGLELRASRRPGAVTAAAAVTWLGVAGASWLADSTGVW